MTSIIAPIKEEKKELKPSDFPPTLRKIAESWIRRPINGDKPTLKTICEELKITPHSASQAIYRYNQKGLNFYDLMNDIVYQRLKNNTHAVDEELVERASSGAHKHMELFYKRVRAPGFTDPKTEINVSIAANFNTIVCPSGPPDLEPIETVETEEDPDADT